MTLAQNSKSLAYFLRRALRAGPDEWQVRIRQKAFCEISRLLAGRNRAIFPRDGHARALGAGGDNLVQWWQARGHCWFLNSARTIRIRRYFDDHGDLATPIIQLANGVLEDEFPILGHGPIKFEGEKRWHRDPILGTVAPQIYHGGIRYLDVAEVGDSKRVWEPSRFGWAYSLGMAYTVTGEPSYAEKFRELTLDWFADNPYPRGIHFCSALELGFRAYAWVWALDLFRDYVAREPALLDKLLYGIWVSCRHIEHNLSYYFAPNTHLLGEAFALYACGAALPEFAQSSRWRRLGMRILAQEAKRQFHGDGTHRELSSCYHLYATDFYLQALLIARQTGLSVDGTVEATARRSAIRLAQLAPDSLQMPQFNDCDGGRLTWFCREPLDAAPSLLAAKQLWDHPALPGQDGPRNGYHLWMCHHRDSVASATSCSTADTKAHNGRYDSDSKCNRQPDSGIAAYRNRAGDYLLFRSGPFGYMDCGHSHDAPTSFTLCLAGRPLFVDCGTGSYTQSREKRDRFRGAFGKNILLVNGRGPSLTGDWFSWQRKADASLTSAKRFPGGFLCQGQHEAFSHGLGFRVEISRRLVLYDDGILVVADQWRAERPISCSLALTLDPSLTPEVSDNGAILQDSCGKVYRLMIQRFPAPFEILVGPTLPGETCAGRHGVSEPADSPERRLTQQSGETPAALSVPRKVAKGPYSPAYGVIGETDYLECDFGTSREGCVLTIVSRAGKISATTKDVPTETVFAVGGQRANQVCPPETLMEAGDPGRIVAMAR